MKIGKLILKYEEKIQNLKKEVEELMDHESYLERKLADHEKEYAEFTKRATDKIQELKKQKGGLDFLIESISYTVDTDHGRLVIRLPYQYSKIKHLKPGDAVKVIFQPETDEP